MSISGRAYTFDTGGHTWSEALAWCVGQGLGLVDFDSQAKFRDLRHIVGKSCFI